MASTTERLRAACERVQARGYSVLPGHYGVVFDAGRARWKAHGRARKRMCPLGAVVVVEQPIPARRTVGTFPSVPRAAREALGVDVEWVVMFQATFDGVIVDHEGDAADTARAMLVWLSERAALAADKNADTNSDDERREGSSD